MFSDDWDNQYKNNAQMSTWPWSDLISMYMRYVNPQLKAPVKVLELGVGAGANIAFFEALSVNYFAIEGSPFIVEKLRQKHGEFGKNIVAADFTKEIPFTEKFDVIIDRSSLTHNTTKDIKHCLELIKSQLNVGGFFIGIDWFSTLHSDKKYAEKQLDDNTFADFTEGNFAQVGDVHFSDDKHIKALFNQYTLLVLEHKVHQQFIPNTEKYYATWDFVAQRDK